MQINRSTFSILFYINTSKTKKSGKCPILGRISIDGENTAFSTGLEITPSDWNVGSGKVVSKSSESLIVNRQIENYKMEVGKHYRNMLENKGYVTAEMLKNALRGIGTYQNTVMQEFSNFLEEKKKEIGIKNAENTYIQYCKGYQHFKNFLKEKLGVDDIPFGKVNIALIEDYAYYLKVDLKLSAWSVHSFIAPLRTTVKIGGLNSNAILPYIDFDLIKNNSKIIVGYSDVTALLLPIFLQSNLVTFYGTAFFSEWGEFPYPFEETVLSFEKCTFNNMPYGEIERFSFWTDEFLD
ncbi:MAG: LD-carboxypeptidase [Dysgonamonadaceae bacterium]|jgi:hypothetical protein|nr:LD-carboxypeptidase [Dysgonamonadaceae bacterium]